ncbi:MAG: YdeI/OmpD-associated family protein [Saccharospirillaceae bacterium]|nr:YdeI/OmpD-associated family protein [Saccharospirillaceae bacterium]MCD8531401.1 YdeI/OmpD-associated family protein [Saccharospirillaceae bacterium]
MLNISGGLVHQMPADLAGALRQKMDAVDLWETLTPIARNEFICWIDDAKQEQTRINRIRRTVEDILGGKKRPCCWPGCIHRTDKKPGKWQQDVLIEKHLKK